MIETKPVKMLQPPAIIISNGQKYAVGGNWVKIPNDVTHENLHIYAIYERTEIEKPTKKYLVSSSRGNKKYSVEVWKNGNVTCDCSGYKWRNKCKHSQAVKKIKP